MILKFISYIVGKLAYLRHPRPLVRAVIRWYVNYYKVDLSEALRDIHGFESLGDLFIRDLRAECRPITGALCSPVDGTLRERGSISKGAFYLVKGKEYTLPLLTGNEKQADRFQDGTFCNFYLSPKDYHHIHSPVSGKILGWEHIPGKLWPVNSWAIKNIHNLFAVNERIVTYIESAQHGLVAVIMVGALNVGSIKLTFDSVITNANPILNARRARWFEVPIPVGAGQRIGTFRMGSAVVLLVERAQLSGSPPKDLPQTMRFGEALV